MQSYTVTAVIIKEHVLEYITLKKMAGLAKMDSYFFLVIISFPGKNESLNSKISQTQ